MAERATHESRPLQYPEPERNDSRGKQTLRYVLIAGLSVAIIAGIVLWRHRMNSATANAKTPSPTYVGQSHCAECHAAEAQAWRASHHALAMQSATDASMLGNFNDTGFTKDGVTSTLYKKADRFWVRTDGPDTKLHDYQLPYSFGVYPLQQYLAEFPNGRLQSLALAWDSRPLDKGGQRWFHLYPNQVMRSGDPLHWTGRNQVWNYMCADCHSTDLRKNYNLSADGYATTWSEIDVACEACHGPGSAHVAWARSHPKDAYKKGDPVGGVILPLGPGKGMWASGGAGDKDTLHWQGAPRSRSELEVCAPCHSRRRPLTDNYVPGQHFLDAYAPSLLEEGLYFADGQILEEDYEYGSFVQSKMFREGVSCSDCHDPHSAKLRQSGLTATCRQCHSSAKYDTTEHHHHPAGTPAAECVNCHMPTRTYMVVDVRRDHSFRVPRPDFTVLYGTPNACNQCHKDKPAKWAADAVVRWYGPTRRREPHFVEALDAGRRGLPQAEKLLAALISDSSSPAIARATALTLLSPYLTPSSISAVQVGLGDQDALVRGAAVRALEPLTPEARLKLAAPLLTDSIRSVRIEAARCLVGTPPQLLLGGQKELLDRVVAELIATDMVSAERPENHMNLASVYAQLGRPADAESELKTALLLDPAFIPAMVNLADLYRAQNRESEAQQMLEHAIAINPSAAEPVHALGLLMVRTGRRPQALELLARASKLQPTNVRYAYVYGVALHSNGEVDNSIAVMKEAHKIRPADREVLMALITFERDKGDFPSATDYAKQLVELTPTDPQARELLANLLKQRM